MSAAQDRALSFGAVAAEYDRLRPAPAPAALDWLVPDPCRLAVDLAAGTGLFTRSLLPRADEVVAVEPDPRMRELFTSRTPGVAIRDGRGESIPVGDAAADLVTISSAWHWLDPEVATPEIARVLRDGGRLAVIWTHMAHKDGLPSPDWAALGVDRAAERIRLHEVQLPSGSAFSALETASFDYPKRVSKADVIASLATYSPVIALAQDVRNKALRDAAEQLDQHFPGKDSVEVTITSRCIRANRLLR